MTLKKIDAAEARKKGLLRYFTGKLCKYGHTSERYTKGGDCIACCRERHKTAEYLEKNRIRARARYQANPEKYRQAQRANRSKNPERVRTVGREGVRRRMGLPAPTRKVPAACENCNMRSFRTVLHLDHCHSTGVFRGWLCHKCNMGLGLLGDSVESLERAIRYLKRAQLK